jgi:hypothetical protein
VVATRRSGSVSADRHFVDLPCLAIDNFPSPVGGNGLEDGFDTLKEERKDGGPGGLGGTRPSFQTKGLQVGILGTDEGESMSHPQVASCSVIGVITLIHSVFTMIRR